MVKEKVLAGRYKDYLIVYDHIRNPSGDDIYFNSLTVKEFEPFDHSKNGVWEGIVVSVPGAINAGDVDKDQRLISVVWRNGDKSMLQVNTITYNRLMEAVLGHVPEEKKHITDTKTVKKNNEKEIT